MNPSPPFPFNQEQKKQPHNHINKIQHFTKQSFSVVPRTAAGLWLSFTCCEIVIDVILNCIPFTVTEITNVILLATFRFFVSVTE